MNRYSRYIDADKLYQKMLDLQGTKRERFLDIDEVRKIIKNETPTEDVVSIKEIINEIDELYYDFENSDGNLTTFIIDGETLHTDVGYAIVGIEFYKNILTKRIGKTYKIPTHAKWVKDDSGNIRCFRCCGIRRDSRADYVRFCNRCGIKMDGGSKNDIS